LRNSRGNNARGVYIRLVTIYYALLLLLLLFHYVFMVFLIVFIYSAIQAASV